MNVGCICERVRATELFLLMLTYHFVAAEMLFACLYSASLVELNLVKREIVVVLWLDVEGRVYIGHFRDGPARGDTKVSGGTI